MRLGRPSLVLALVAPTLAGCGLLDLGGSSTVEDAFEYLPAATFSVRFADRAAMAERLGLDDIDPRDATQADIDDYLAATQDKGNGALATTAISASIEAMKDAPLNEFDIEWQAEATWGDDPEQPAGSAYVWKVGDDLDFDALADDLEQSGYEREGSSDLPVYAVDMTSVDEDTGQIGGLYPLPMVNVLLDEDDQIIATGAGTADSVADIADVIADDADSLADDGGMDDLLDATDEDPELARLTTAGPALCADLGGKLPEDLRQEYADLGRPASRALFISGDDPTALLVLQYDDEDAARDDLEAREALLEDGVELLTAQPFDELGDFEIERDGDRLLIDEDWKDGPGPALSAETDGGGPGFCLQAAD